MDYKWIVGVLSPIFLKLLLKPHASRHANINLQKKKKKKKSDKKKNTFTAILVINILISPLINIPIGEYRYGHMHRRYAGLSRNLRLESHSMSGRRLLWDTAKHPRLTKHVCAAALSHRSRAFLSVRVTRRDVRQMAVVNGSSVTLPSAVSLAGI